MADHTMSIRDARAHLAGLVSRAESGDPTVITRNGAPAAAVVPMEDFEALEEALDMRLAQQADLDGGGQDDAPVGMAEMVAEIFDERRSSAT
ncbi:type II toxin-antitoxin system Phd/YefM family antitoxin [Nocardiopsis sp. LOL_012]|uniref:type II toxin-antitoxin system Phd/YefM family antitoxin n=1 Tax=Nocardiopsis sp. LOL_012 TaxID=3345409 RepID=UPI003A8BE220